MSKEKQEQERILRILDIFTAQRRLGARPVVKAIVHSSDGSRTLFVASAKNPKKFNLVGGGFEPSDHDLIDAWLREFFEEMGFRLDRRAVKVRMLTAGRVPTSLKPKSDGVSYRKKAILVLGVEVRRWRKKWSFNRREISSVNASMSVLQVVSHLENIVRRSKKNKQEAILYLRAFKRLSTLLPGEIKKKKRRGARGAGTR